MSDPNTIELATELTIAWLGNPSTRASADEVNAFLTSMNDTLGGLTSPAASQPDEEAARSEYTPAVSVRKSLGSRDHIISMIDGKPYKTLRRHLATNGLTPDEYRARYNLKADYPMVAPAYSEIRRETAKRLGLGRKPADTAQAESAPAAAPVEAPPRAAPFGAPERKPRARKGAADSAAAASDASPEQMSEAAAPAPKPRARKSAAEAKAAAKKHLGD